MLKKGLIGLAVLIIGLGIAMLASKDVRRFFLLYADGSSNALKQVELEGLTPEEQGAYYFLQGDFGALSTDTLSGSATPWALTATVIALDYVDGDRTRLNRDNMIAAFRQFGMTSAQTIANWPDTLPPPVFEAPVGLSIGSVERKLPSIKVTAANLGCAMCHSSVVYGADGVPDPDAVWIGPPNASAGKCGQSPCRNTRHYS